MSTKYLLIIAMDYKSKPEEQEQNATNVAMVSIKSRMNFPQFIKIGGRIANTASNAGLLFAEKTLGAIST
jgi:hypothetical protein